MAHRDAFLAERKNPASYWSRLSQDVVDYYLINQYALFWLKDLHWELVSQKEKREKYTEPTMIAATTWQEMILEFFPGGQLIIKSNGSTRTQRYIPYEGKYYVAYTQMGQEKKEYMDQLHVFDENYQYGHTFDFPVEGISLLKSGELVVYPSLDDANQEMIIYSPGQSTPRHLVLATPTSRISHSYIHHGIKFIITPSPRQLLLFSWVTGQFIRAGSIDYSTGFTSMEVEADGELILKAFAKTTIFRLK